MSFDYTKAGVDTGELIIRGGTHYGFDWIPNDVFPATLPGADMIAWYTTAWFDKYLKHDCTAEPAASDTTLASRRPRSSDRPNHDGNMFSFYYRSRLDIHLADGRRYDNESLRENPNGLTFKDGYPGEYSYLDIDRSPDVATTDFGSCHADARTHHRHRRRAFTQL